ncbi:hypothetical protein BH10PLA2_BH10PLA2_00650 [soil metagenome]
MGTPSNPLQAAIYTRLTGYAALSALATGGIYDFVPEDAVPPYVVIGDDTAIDWGTKTANGWDTTVTIHCWDFEKAGRKSVKAILSAIYDALHRQETNITISGFSLIMIQHEFETTLQDPSAEGQGDRFYHGIQRYRLLIQS